MKATRTTPHGFAPARTKPHADPLCDAISRWLRVARELTLDQIVCRAAGESTRTRQRCLEALDALCEDGQAWRRACNHPSREGSEFRYFSTVPPRPPVVQEEPDPW